LPLRVCYNLSELDTLGLRGPLMSVESAIREKLTQALQPTRLDVVNESHLHAGHRTSPGTGESHFRVLVVSQAFAGKSRIDRHRIVNDTLAAELKGRVHALAIKAYAPGEATG
jgi:BolA family transcriptional regulator, general stress-responsive regulator